MIKKASSYFRIGNLGLTLVVMLLYYILMRTGIILRFQDTSLTPVWLLTGIAFASVLLLGLRVIPGILLGSVLSNVLVFSSDSTSTYSVIIISILVPVGVALEMIAGYALLRRVSEKVIGFEKIKSVF